jgi:hypothetical protein
VPFVVTSGEGGTPEGVPYDCRSASLLHPAQVIDLPGDRRLGGYNATDRYRR